MGIVQSAQIRFAATFLLSTALIANCTAQTKRSAMLAAANGS